MTSGHTLNASPTTRAKPLRALAKRQVLPGFGLSMGYTISFLSLLVLIPLAALVLYPIGLGPAKILAIMGGKRVLAACWLSFTTALGAASISTVFGVISAWVLVRYRFPGRRILDILVDLPFALPTAVAGISLAALFSKNGWLGQYLEPVGIHIVNTPAGIMLAMVFIGFPFVVRTVQPVIQELEPEIEDAASSLGASRWQTIRRIIFPTLIPAILTGFTLCFARAIGEYGSVIFISGNLPFKTEIAPLLIMAKLDQFDYAGAAVIATLLLGISFLMLLALNALQGWQQRRSR